MRRVAPAANAISGRWRVGQPVYTHAVPEGAIATSSYQRQHSVPIPPRCPPSHPLTPLPINII